MSECESTPTTVDTMAERTVIKSTEEAKAETPRTQQIQQAEPNVVGKSKRKPKEPKQSKVIVVAVNPTEFFF
ncbi:MAG: hypothetical protein ACKPKO_16415 [Candidatus Fonsibacter sp.]